MTSAQWIDEFKAAEAEPMPPLRQVRPWPHHFFQGFFLAFFNFFNVIGKTRVTCICMLIVLLCLSYHNC